LEIETYSVDIPFDFYVTGISPRNAKKAAKLKSTDFRVISRFDCRLVYLTRQSDDLSTGARSDAFLVLCECREN